MMAREFIPELPLRQGFDQWYQSCDHLVKNGEQMVSLLGQKLANSHVYLARPTGADGLWTVRGGPSANSQLTRRCSARLAAPTTYTFQSGLRVAGAFTTPPSGKAEHLLKFEGLLKNGVPNLEDATECTKKLSVEIHWLLPQKRNPSLLTVRTIVWVGWPWSRQPERFLAMEETFRVSALPPAVMRLNGWMDADIATDSSWEEAVKETQAIVTLEKKSVPKYQNVILEDYKWSTVSDWEEDMVEEVSTTCTNTDPAEEVRMATKELLYGSAFRAALFADIELVSPLEHLELPPKQGRWDICLCATVKKTAAVKSGSCADNVAAAVDCPTHGHCNMCEMGNEDCVCEWWWEVHACKHCGCQLWRCECARVRLCREMYLPPP